MSLTIDPERQVEAGSCACCTTPYDRVTGFINSEESGAYAIYYASCYHHQGVHEAYIDVILDDDWDPEHPASRPGPRRATFGCRVGPVDGQDGPACSLVPAASVAPDDPLYGHKLTRDEALAHPWLAAYWQTIDLILLEDPTVHAHFTAP